MVMVTLVTLDRSNKNKKMVVDNTLVMKSA
jgi:hypothetical protein